MFTLHHWDVSTGDTLDIVENFINKFVNQIQEFEVIFANNAPRCVDKIFELIII